jgi:hypothetical protein
MDTPRPVRRLAPVSSPHSEPILPASDVMRWIEDEVRKANDLWSNSCLIDQVPFKPLATKADVLSHLSPDGKADNYFTLRLAWEKAPGRIKAKVRLYLQIRLRERAAEAGVEPYIEEATGADGQDGDTAPPTAPQQHTRGENNMSTATTPFNAPVSNSDGGDYERPPAGMHPAVLVALIDLGTHTRTNDKGQAWDSRKILFVWELTDEPDKAGNNFVVGQDFTWSLNKNANLRHIIEGWIGRTLNVDEHYDFGHLLGQSCVVTLTEGLSKNGKKYVNLTGVGKPMRGMTVPPAKLPTFAFSLAEQDMQEGDPAIPAWVPLMYGRKVVDEIKASHEWQGSTAF